MYRRIRIRKTEKSEGTSSDPQDRSTVLGARRMADRGTRRSGKRSQHSRCHPEHAITSPIEQSRLAPRSSWGRYGARKEGSGPDGRKGKSPDIQGEENEEHLLGRGLNIESAGRPERVVHRTFRIRKSDGSEGTSSDPEDRSIDFGAKRPANRGTGRSIEKSQHSKRKREHAITSSIEQTRLTPRSSWIRYVAQHKTPIAQAA